jgi:butyryl-CoA dehydrogenase
MPVYKAPLRDLRFAYYELHDGAGLAELPGYEDATPDLMMAVLEEMGKICEEVIQPLNLPGDDEGCSFSAGEVKTPAGFKEAYRTIKEGGWTGLSADPEYGGQGLPMTLSVMIDEMVCSSNLSFAMYLSLTHGAYDAIRTHADEELRQRFLPKFVEGDWSATMCLTEPQCGTDLGQVRTRAEPAGDGTWRVTGNKIFVSAGDHDLTENIVHLVLVRLPDAPPGIKGISLMVIPKLLDKGGELVPNGVSCASIEHKMGIKGSSTCVINFEDSVGYLVGEPHRGMRGMFTFMNGARLHVGVQGLALSEVAYQNAVNFARERLQGRSLTGAKFPDLPADPILVHPDVRRMLLTARAFNEGFRALTAWISLELDHEERNPDPERRKAADDLASLLTPVIKAFLTDCGFEATNLSLQVHGGYGFIHEYGIEQFVRDARITQIYEGTNGIQALDLVGRKLPAHTGRYLRRFFHPVQEFIEAEQGVAEMEEFVAPLAKAFGRLQRATAWLAQASMKNRDEAGGASTTYLHLFGYTALAYMWARAAKVALAKRDGDEAAFYEAKIKTARFYMQRLLPRTGGLFASMLSGCGSMMDFDDEMF